jgi:hypothetical protein
MDLKIPYKNLTDAQSAYQKVQGVLRSQGLEGLPIKPEFEFHDSERLVRAKGKGFDLKATFQDKELIIELNMGLLFRAFKDGVLKKIETKLKNIV